MPPAGLPRDPAQWISLALGALALVFAGSFARVWRRPRAALAALALAAAALSAAYVVVYLRGGPRIIDASSYSLEARGLAGGMLSFPLGEPETSVLGRFLVRSEHAGIAHAAVIFPPGYPAILALGFLAGAPLAVGPVLAALLVLATFAVGRRIASVPVAQVASVLSVVCAALRYHTADTMSHGLAALCFTACLALVLRAADASSPGDVLASAAVGGLAAGWLLATRPFSAGALAVTVLYLLARDERARPRAGRVALAMALGALPGVALLLLHQHAATGSWLTSSQRAYYAVSDGPSDCFRYGFGAGVGCLGEHGDFVRARLASGFGLVPAIGTTLRRLKMHLVDAGNVEILGLLVPYGAFVARSSPRGRALGVAVTAQILAYLPFYFDGNYPAGGARFFCDVLPLEHVLIALAASSLAAKRGRAERWSARPVGIALLGFAVRAGFDHAQLRDRDGGRPFFEARVLADAGISAGLVFFDSDHGFDLAFDPTGRAPIQAARFHGDALDRAAWEALGRPPAYRYRFEIPAADGLARVGVEPLRFADAADPVVIEGESLWPPIAQQGAFGLVEWAAGSCASNDRWLEIHRADPAAPASVTVALPSRLVGGREVRVRLALQGGASGTVTVGDEHARFAAPPTEDASPRCVELPGLHVASARNPRLTIYVEPGGPGALAALDAVYVVGGGDGRGASGANNH